MSAISKFVTNCAKSYLQSVVFVDDNIYSKNGKPREDSIVLPSPGGLKSQFEEDNATAESAGHSRTESIGTENAVNLELSAIPDEQRTSSDVEMESEYHPRQLMESFAKKGIVCALYEPQEKSETDKNSILFQLCERADVVILDWDLFGDDGDRVSKLLAELIKKGQGDLPHYVRLCTLYTNKPNLHLVVDLLFSNLKNLGCKVDVDDGKLRLTAGGTRISLFGKPCTTGRSSDDKQYEVEESKLADKIIEEFASLHYGLMPAFALHGLAAIRRNTKRLLDKFPSELDGAFLLHRALVLDHEEAFHELPELLSDEIRAVLEDAWPGGEPIQNIAASVVDDLALTDAQPSWKTPNGQPYDARPLLRKMLKEGVAPLVEVRTESNEASEFKKGKGFRGINPARLKNFEAMLEVNGECWSESLAALFCNRTQYGSSERTLRFGTVVRHQKEGDPTWAFSVCLMPICDSQRLKTSCHFPFWKLKPNVKCGQPSKRHGIVVNTPDGKTHCLAAGGKIRDMFWIASFDPDKSTGKVITTGESQTIFLTDGLVVEWVADLKPLHAQRIAAYMGAEVSRVGLVESEWLRLFCDR